MNGETHDGDGATDTGAATNVKMVSFCFIFMSNSFMSDIALCMCMFLVIVNMRNVKLTAYHNSILGLYPFIPFSVSMTLTMFQGHSSIKFQTEVVRSYMIMFKLCIIMHLILSFSIAKLGD